MGADFCFCARSSASLAYFLNYNLELIFDHIKFLQPSSAGEVFEQILTIEKGDVLFAISFPRYSKKVVDAVAASLILEGYLTFKKSR